MQAMVHKTISSILESIDFDNWFQQTINDMLSSPWYLANVTEALLNTEEFLHPMVQAIKTEADKVMDVNSKQGDRDKTFVQAADRVVSARSSSPNKSPPMAIDNDRTNERAYFPTVLIKKNV